MSDGYERFKVNLIIDEACDYNKIYMYEFGGKKNVVCCAARQKQMEVICSQLYFFDGKLMDESKFMKYWKLRAFL